MKYDKLLNRSEAYIYTDAQERRWEVWRQGYHGVNQWAIKCLEENMELFDDAYATRTSAVKQIQYLSLPNNELHERKMHRRLLEQNEKSRKKSKKGIDI